MCLCKRAFTTIDTSMITHVRCDCDFAQLEWGGKSCRNKSAILENRMIPETKRHPYVEHETKRLSENGQVLRKAAFEGRSTLAWGP